MFYVIFYSWYLKNESWDHCHKACSLHTIKTEVLCFIAASILSNMSRPGKRDRAKCTSSLCASTDRLSTVLKYFWTLVGYFKAGCASSRHSCIGHLETLHSPWASPDSSGLWALSSVVDCNKVKSTNMRYFYLTFLPFTLVHFRAVTELVRPQFFLSGATGKCRWETSTFNSRENQIVATEETIYFFLQYILWFLLCAVNILWEKATKWT